MIRRSLLRAALPATLALIATSQPLSAQQSCPATTPGATMPLTYQGGPTVAAITACDLMTRLYIYAADSMRGREAGTPDAIRATAWIEREVRRLGLRPAGDNGTYFQSMPVSARAVSRASTIVSGGKTFRADVDFYPGGATTDRKITADVVFGGVLGDTVNTLSAEDARGKIVVVTAPANGCRQWFRRGLGRRGSDRTRQFPRSFGRRSDSSSMTRCRTMGARPMRRRPTEREWRTRWSGCRWSARPWRCRPQPPQRCLGNRLEVPCRATKAVPPRST